MQSEKRLSPPLPPVRDLFLSHRSTNKGFVRQLAAEIEAESNGHRTLLTWLDEAEIHPGQSVPGQIEHGLEISRFVGIAMTPSYFASASGWTDAEWHAALHVDPDNRRGRILPLLVEDCPFIPYLLRHLDAIDLRGENYTSGLRRLLAVLRGEPLPRPVAHRGQLITPTGRIDRSTLVAERTVPEASPDVVSERLYCNLLPIESVPRFIYAAPVAASLCHTRPDGTRSLPSKQALRDRIRQVQHGAGHSFMPAFRLVGDRIITFHDLESEESPCSAIIEPEADMEVYETARLLQDEDSRHVVISLLNMALGRHLNRVGLVIDSVKRDRYFFPPKNGGEAVISWRPRRARRASRTVAKPMIANGHIQFWRHLGAYMAVVYLASRLYILIKPTWVLTTDGVQVMTGPDVGKRVIKWTGAERNLQLLFHVRFWTTILRLEPGPLAIRVGDQRMEIASVPAMIQLPYGIADDQRDLMAQLAEEAELLAEEEDALVEAAVSAQLAQGRGALEEEDDEDEDFFAEGERDAY